VSPKTGRLARGFALPPERARQDACGNKPDQQEQLGLDVRFHYLSEDQLELEDQRVERHCPQARVVASGTLLLAVITKVNPQF
jgi:hypothetical protein